MNVKKTTLLSMFLALALVLSYVESMIPFFFGVPGMKLGLSNAMVMVLLYLYGTRECILINVLRILITGMLFGNAFSIIYSLGGAALSLIVMLLVKRIKLLDIIVVSVCGGIAHNIGQLMVAAAVFNSIYLWYYLPVLMLGGFVSGGLIGVIAKGLISRLRDIFTES